MYINNLGHMTKMAAMPIYGKNPSKNYFSRTGGPTSKKLSLFRLKSFLLQMDLFLLKLMINVMTLILV